MVTARHPVAMLGPSQLGHTFLILPLQTLLSTGKRLRTGKPRPDAGYNSALQRPAPSPLLR